MTDESTTKFKRISRNLYGRNVELWRANARLKQLDKLKDEFLCIASHELRTPLSVIEGYLWMVTSDKNKLPPKIKQQLEQAHFSAQQLTILANNILDVSKIEAGTLSVNPKKIDISKLLKEVVEELMFVFEKQSLEVEIPKTKMVKVFADPARIRQVVINLLSNAVRYTGKGGKISLEILPPNPTNPFITIAISDTGCGIHSSDIPKLFRKFGCLPKTERQSSHSLTTGLGLFICKQIIEKSGGKIDVTAKLGRGSRFVFTLPRC